MRRTRRLTSHALAASALVALAAPAAVQAAPAADVVASAKRTARVLSLSSPPPTAAPGDVLRFTGRVANRSNQRARIQLTLTLRKSRTATTGRKLGARRMATLRPGKVGRYRMSTRLPTSLAAGRYRVRACALIPTATGNSGVHCRFAKRAITVTRSAGQPPGNPPASPPGGQPGQPSKPDQPDKRYDVLVLTESRSTEDAAATAAGVDAITELGRGGEYKVTVAPDSRGHFTEANLMNYRTVVFLNTSGDVLSANEESAFEDYFKQGGGFFAIGSAIAGDPSSAFMTSLLGTRAQGARSAQEAATIKVADRVHDASKSLPERFDLVDSFYNTTSDVRGLQHVLATVDEGSYEENDGPNGADDGRADDHPVMWCQDMEGGRAFYTATGHNAATFANAEMREHLAGAIKWAAGRSDTTYSDCGATVLANYKQIKISAPPNLNEPIGFDQLPDGSIIQTARAGQVNLHDPEGGTSTPLANLANNPQFPKGLYSQSEDGLYGPAVDREFATNKWVYLYYSPATVTNVRQSDGSIAPSITTPLANAPTTAASLSAWDPYVGYFQLSRFKFVEAAAGEAAHLDLGSEQEIMRVPVNRGACCHVGGDIDFDEDNNLWLVTGDDTPAGGGNSGGFGPFNDMRTNESQTVRVTNATGGAFTLTFEGQTTAAIDYNATAAAIQAALEALSNIAPGDVAVTGGPVNTANVTVNFRGAHEQRDVAQMTSDGTALTGGDPAPAITHNTTTQGALYNAPFVDARRSALNTNDLRGKVMRIKVAGDGSYTVPSGNLFPPGTAGTRPEIYAMGFRNPFRIQVDSNDVAYITDYSPDANAPQDLRGPAGTGRVEVVRKPANYGWPICMSPDVPMFKWDFNTSTPLPSMANPETWDCDNPAGLENTSKWNTGQQVDGTVQPGRTATPPLTPPDLWYSYNDNRANDPLGTPCFGSYDNVDTADRCPQLFPELFTGGVGPHGATAYEYDPDNASETKFPPYYDGAMILAEFTQNSMREVRFDSSDEVLEINPFLNCGEAFLAPTPILPFECDNPMDLQFGADGNFYLLTYGDGFFAANADAGMYRWEYTKGPQRPRAVVSATPRNGPAPLTVQFRSDGSRDDDPDDSITFAWDFNNDGTVDSIDPNPQHTYTANGVYTARLTVTDSTGKSASASTVITVGNTAPTVTITTPLDGDFFAFGDSIPWSVTVTDPEDGPVDTPAECARVTVTFVLIHDTHGHAETEQSGCSGVMPTDASLASHGGYLAGGMSVSYTDNAQGSVPALQTTTQHVVQLRRHEVEFAQEQFGVTHANAEGGRAASSIDPGDWIALNNRINLTNMNKEITFRYAGGAAGVTLGAPRMLVEIRQGSPTGTVLATATLTATGTNNNTYADQTVPLDFTGSQRLYLVFQSVAGGPTAAMGNLNWVQFSGSGAGVTP